MGRMSRNKGKRGEYEVRDLLRAFGHEARRGQQFNGTPESPDVIHDLEGLHIEVKHVEKLNLYKAFEQSLSDCGDMIPSVWHRKNHSPWMVTMRAEDFLKLFSEKERGRKVWEACWEYLFGPGDKDLEKGWQAYKEKNP